MRYRYDTKRELTCVQIGQLFPLTRLLAILDQPFSPEIDPFFNYMI